MTLFQRWLWGLLMGVNLFVIYLLIKVVALITLAPSIVLYHLYLDQRAHPGAETTASVCFSLAIAYAILVAPLVTTWVAKWKGMPTWGDLRAPGDDHG